MSREMLDLLQQMEEQAAEFYAMTRGEVTWSLVQIPRSKVPLYQNRAAALSKIVRVMRGIETP